MKHMVKDPKLVAANIQIQVLKLELEAARLQRNIVTEQAAALEAKQARRKVLGEIFYQRVLQELRLRRAMQSPPSPLALEILRIGDAYDRKQLPPSPLGQAMLRAADEIDREQLPPSLPPTPKPKTSVPRQRLIDGCTNPQRPFPAALKADPATRKSRSVTGASPPPQDCRVP